MTARVVVVGAVNVDLVVPVAHLPRPGETVVGGPLGRHGGGKGANAAVAAARSGAAVTLVGAVGDDDLGRLAAAGLTAEGVDTAALTVVAGAATGVALIPVAPDGGNQIVVAAGANALLDPDAVSVAIAAAGAGCVVVSNEVPERAVAAAVAAARRLGLPCVLDPAPATAGLAAWIGPGVVVTPNAAECAALLDAVGGDGCVSPGMAARELARRRSATVIATLGADGVALAEPGRPLRTLEALATPAVDTTGAGDTFAGVLGARLAGGTPLEEATVAATAAASLSVAAVGARTAMPAGPAIDRAVRGWGAGLR